MIHNLYHDKCITIESNHIVGLTCNENLIDQVWHWTIFGQLQNMGSLQCLRAPDSAVDRGIVIMTQCDRNDSNQIWIRQKKLILLNDESFLLNLGNSGNTIVLMESIWQGPWSKWELEISAIANGMVVIFIQKHRILKRFKSGVSDEGCSPGS